MTIKYVNSAATGSNNGTSKLNAYTTILAAVNASTAADTILVASTHTGNAGASTTYAGATGPGMKVISIDWTTDVYTPGAVESNTGSGAGQTAITFNNSAAYYGITFNTSLSASTAIPDISFVPTLGPRWAEFTDCSFRINSNTNVATARFIFGATGTSTANAVIKFVRCGFRAGHANNALSFRYVMAELIGCSFEAAGSVPTNLFEITSLYAGAISMLGCDWSLRAATQVLARTAAESDTVFDCVQCKFNASTSLIPSGAGGASNSGVAFKYFDCMKDTTTGIFGYVNALGSLFNATATYFTGGAASQSWAITTASTVLPEKPFTTPWIDFYNTNNSSITPYIEVLRNNGSAAAYTDAQLWAEWSVETTASSSLGTFKSDQCLPNATAASQAAGAGTGSWTIGSSSSPFSMKLDTGAAVTPAVDGLLRGRVVVGIASLSGTLYIDPQIRI